MDDYRNSIDGPGALGNFTTGTSITGTIEAYGDLDVFRTTYIGGLTYTVSVVGIGANPLGAAFLQLDDADGNYQGFVDVPNGFEDGAETSGFRYLTLYDPYGEEAGFDTLGSYRISISAGRGTNQAESIVGTSWGDAVDARGGADFVSGADGADTLAGGDGADTVLGGNGKDVLYGGAGADLLRGQANDDRLTGGSGADILVGGAGRDSFVFASTSQSTDAARDTLRAGDGGAAFEVGEKIDLAAIDANTTIAGDQAFVFGGVLAPGASGLKGRLYVTNVGQDTIFHANTDNDAAWEFAVEIEDGAGRGAAWYHGTDFVL